MLGGRETTPVPSEDLNLGKWVMEKLASIQSGGFFDPRHGVQNQHVCTTHGQDFFQVTYAPGGFNTLLVDRESPSGIDMLTVRVEEKGEEQNYFWDWLTFQYVANRAQILISFLESEPDLDETRLWSQELNKKIKPVAA